jgi:hypothetical protein
MIRQSAGVICVATEKRLHAGKKQVELSVFRVARVWSIGALFDTEVLPNGVLCLGLSCVNEGREFWNFLLNLHDAEVGAVGNDLALRRDTPA